MVEIQYYSAYDPALSLVAIQPYDGRIPALPSSVGISSTKVVFQTFPGIKPFK
jgi:hypothetical protein